MLDAELKIVGTQGPLRGGPDPRGGAGITVLEVRHTLVSVRDATTGQATGRRRHSPIVVLKDVDRASPSLAWAWAHHDVLTTWRLDVFGTDQFGRRRATYSIELKRAAVVEIAVTTPESAPALREAVAFGYEGITWTWHEGRTSTQDEWVAQT